MNIEYPNMLWCTLLVALGVVTLYVWSWRQRKRLLKGFLSPSLLPALTASWSAWRVVTQWSALGAALVLVGISLARPQWGHTWQESKTKGVDVLMVLDVSQSMRARDIKPDRLERAKLAIWDFVQRLEGDPVGLIVFAGQAFLHCPLTVDYDAFRQSLESVDTQLIAQQGTDLAAAIREAQQLFDQEDNFKRLILITDGEDLEQTGLKQAQQAAQEGVVVYTVGVGTPVGELIPVRDAAGKPDYLRDRSGKLVQTRLDPSTLVQIAEATKGFYTPLGAVGEGLDRVYDEALASIPKREREGRVQRIPIERFQGFLAAALGLLVLEASLSNRRRRQPS